MLILNWLNYLSIIASPLNVLTYKNTPFQWTVTQQTAFQQLIQAICLAPVLQVLDSTVTLQVHTDASNKGISTVLLQLKLGTKHFQQSIIHSFSLKPKKTTQQQTVRCQPQFWLSTTGDRTCKAYLLPIILTINP